MRRKGQGVKEREGKGKRETVVNIIKQLSVQFSRSVMSNSL